MENQHCVINSFIFHLDLELFCHTINCMQDIMEKRATFDSMKFLQMKNWEGFNLLLLNNYLIDHVSDHENDEIVKTYEAEMDKVDPAKVLTKDSFPKDTKIKIKNYIKGLHQMNNCDAFLPLLKPWQYKRKMMKIKLHEQKSRGKEKNFNYNPNHYSP